MMETLLEPFAYQYMIRALWMCALVGGTCAFLSAFLMLKGWSLMGDALAHSVVPGVALAYLLGLPYAIGAFFSGVLAAGGMLAVKQKTKLREDAIIGLVFTTFFAIGLLLVSINPTSVNVQAIILGNILAITAEDALQVAAICVISLAVLLVKWKDFLLVFFDEQHAKSLGLRVRTVQVVFFTLLSATTVAALQAVGACLVIALVVTPGTTAYLLSDRFGRLICVAVLMGSISCALGVYLSFFLNANAGGLIVCIQTALFLAAFLFSPKYGVWVSRRRVRRAAVGGAHG